MKQAGNPLFSFLLPADPLHAFYRWLVETRPQDLVVINAAPGSDPGTRPSSGGRKQQRQGREEEEEMEERGGAAAAAAAGAQHPSYQWRVRPAEQPAPWSEPQARQPPPWVKRQAAEQPPWQQAQQAATTAAVEYGPSLPPPGMVGVFSLAA